MIRCLLLSSDGGDAGLVTGQAEKNLCGLLHSLRQKS